MSHSPKATRSAAAHALVQVAVWVWLAGAHAGVMAQVYTGQEEPGASVVLSNFQSNDAPQLLIEGPREARIASTPAQPKVAQAKAQPHLTLRLPSAPKDVRRVIDDVATSVGISPELLHAVIATESNYNSRALSPKGAMGLMQLMPATAQRFGARDPYALRDNVLAGATYLKWLMGLFKDDLELVLAAYNAGENAVLKAGGQIPPYAETQAYVPRVLAFMRCASDTACMPV